MTIDADVIQGVAGRRSTGLAIDAFGQPVGTDRKITEARVKAWLKEKNLSRLFKTLQKHRFDDFETLQALDDGYLREMGVVAGDRVRLLKAIRGDFYFGEGQGGGGSPSPRGPRTRFLDLGGDEDDSHLYHGLGHGSSRRAGERRMYNDNAGRSRSYNYDHHVEAGTTKISSRPPPFEHDQQRRQEHGGRQGHQKTVQIVGAPTSLEEEEDEEVGAPVKKDQVAQQDHERNDNSKKEEKNKAISTAGEPKQVADESLAAVVVEEQDKRDQNKVSTSPHASQNIIRVNNTINKNTPTGAGAPPQRLLPGGATSSRPQLRRSRRYEDLDQVDWNMGSEAANRRKEYAKKVIGVSIFLEGLLIALRATMWWAQCLVYVPLFIANLYGLQWRKRVDVFTALRGLRVVEKQQCGYLGSDVYRSSVAECETVEQGRKLQRGAMLLVSQAVALTSVWVFGLMIFSSVMILADKREDVTFEAVTKSVFQDDSSTFNWFAVTILGILAAFSGCYALLFIAMFRNEYRSGLIKKAHVEELKTKVARLQKLDIKVKNEYDSSSVQRSIRDGVENAGGSRDHGEKKNNEDHSEESSYHRAVDVGKQVDPQIKPLFDLSLPLDEQSLVGKLDVSVQSSTKQNLWEQIGQVGAVVKFLKGGA
ncbi:unnamed protein product [Amoebophrya sp. A25]|nr:unnamed protein product [Amoebophrya sp. A25]|eukprot:GSA25T00019785001.1